jgi:DNA-binding transcriptional ArsR family regulator
MTEPKIALQAELLKVLAQPTRLKILNFLKDGEQCVCDIFPAIAGEQPNVSRHLRLMARHGILYDRKEGVRVYYGVRDPRVFKLLDVAEAILAKQIKDHHALVVS